MPNTRIPNVVLADNLNIQRQRFNQLLDSVGNVSTLTTTDSNVVGAINEHDAELGTITAGAMGTTASTVSTAINELDGRLDSINTTELLSPRATLSDSSATSIVRGNLQIDTGLHVGGNTTMSGTLNVDGEITFKAGTNSNINLGDANTDNVIFNADVNSSIIPNTDDTFDLGSSTQEWRHVYVDGTVFADNVAADSATIDKLVVDDITIDSSTISDAGDFTLDVGGGIILDADDAGTVSLKDGGTRYGVFAKSTNNFDIQSTISDGDVVFKGNDGGSLFTALTLDMSEAGDATFNRNVFLGGLTATAGVNSNAGITIDNITIDGTEIDLSSGDLTIDVAGDIILDAAGGDVFLKDNGTQYASLTNTSNNLIIKSGTTTALTFTGADAAFSGSVTSTGDIAVNGGDLTTTATTFNFVNANATTLNMGSDATVVSIGNHSTGITTVQHDLVVDSNLTVHGISNLDSTNVVGTLSINGAADITGSLNVTDGFTVGGTFTTTGTTRNASSHLVVNDGVAISNSNRAGLAVDRPSGDSAVFQWNEATDVWEFAGPKTGTVAVTSDIGNATITIQGGTELETGGSFTTNASGNSSITLDHSNVSRSDTTTTASPGNAGTFTAVDSITSNARGHITAANVKTITMPSAYSHPTHDGDDIDIDTGALTGATVISDLDFNVTTDTLGHVTDASGTVATRTLTLANLGYTGDSDANKYVHPNHTGEVTSTGDGATVVADNTIDEANLKVSNSPVNGYFLSAQSGNTGGLTWAVPTDTNTTDWRVSNSGGVEQFAVSATEEVRFAGSGATSISFNASTQTVTVSSTDTNTDTNTTDFNIQANGGTEVNISAGEEINFINGNATTAVVVDQANPTVTFNHNDTSSQTSVNNSGRTYIQDVTLDSYGHVTGLVSATETVTNTDTTYTAGTDLDLSFGNQFSIESTLNGVSAIERTSGDINILCSGGGKIDLSCAGGDIELDAAGKIILDADDEGKIEFKNGAGGDTVTHSLSNTAEYKITSLGDTEMECGNFIVDASADITLDAGGVGASTSQIFLLGGGASRGAFTLDTANTIKLELNVAGTLYEKVRIISSGMALENGLYVGAATGTPVDNEIRAEGNITAFYSSDISLKENIVKIDHAMDKIQSIRGVYFDWTDEHIESRGGEDGYFVQKHDVGVIAQEVEPVLPEVVRDRKDGTKAVDYQKMVAVLIEGMKEQQQQINELRSEIQNLKG